MKRIWLSKYRATLLALIAALPAWALDPDGLAAGHAGNAVIQPFVNAPSASAVVPGYTTTPPQTAYAGQPSLGATVTAQKAACLGSTDPSCQAIMSATDQAALPRQAISPHDPNIAGATAISRNPSLVLGDLSAYYAGCSTSTVTAPSSTETKICRTYPTMGDFRCSAKLLDPNTMTWDDGCAMAASSATCTRKSGPVCVDGPSVKNIGGQDVLAACWEYQSTFDCGSAATDQCAPLVAAGCVQASGVCEANDPLDPMICGVWRYQYNCPKPSQPVTTVSNCTSPCPTTTRLVSPAVYDEQVCYQFLDRNEDAPCTKALHVSVTWTCPANAVSGPTRNIDPVTGSAEWTCVVPVPTLQTYCPVGMTGPLQTIHGEICIDTQGDPTPTPTQIVYVNTPQPATPVVAEVWNNGCATFETRVPPGLLPPDGADLPQGAIATGPGPINKCQRDSSVCADSAPQTRIINDYPVTRSCWAYANKFSCVDNNSVSDCAQSFVGDCVQNGPQQCIDYDTFFNPPVCTAYQTSFRCKQADAVYETVADCGGLNPSDQDFARTVTFLEAGREAGAYLDPATMKVFNGADSRCKRKLFGLVNCCKRAGSGTGSLNNLNVAMAAGSSLGKAAFSTYTFDALFASDAPNWAITGFEHLFDQGYSSALAGLMAGQLSVEGLLQSLVPGPWSMVWMAIQFSGIMNCDKRSLETGMKRDANLCRDIGEYCSKRLSVIRTCVERTRTYCCFNSRLSRLINEQGRAQLGMGWGSARRPQCSGFTVEQLQSLNFAAMDLTEFYKEITPTMTDWSAAVPGVATKIPTCYYGDGKC